MSLRDEYIKAGIIKPAGVVAEPVANRPRDVVGSVLPSDRPKEHKAPQVAKSQTRPASAGSHQNRRSTLSSASKPSKEIMGVKVSLKPVKTSGRKGSTKSVAKTYTFVLDKGSCKKSLANAFLREAADPYCPFCNLKFKAGTLEKHVHLAHPKKQKVQTKPAPVTSSVKATFVSGGLPGLKKR